MANQVFCLKRNNHLNDMVVGLEEMLKDENMVDVALSCEEGIIKAHKIILSANSNYFRQIFSKVQLNNQYPIIIIKDMSYQDLKYIIDFIYRGEIEVPHQHLNSVLKSAEALKIKGLADLNSQKASSKNDEHLTGLSRKKKKKRRKTSNDDKQKDKQSLNSSEDISDYSDEDLIHNQTNSLSIVQSHQLNSQNILDSQSAAHQLNSPSLNNETEIEPSRLLEQTMITGDAQNIQPLASALNNQNKYPQYLISSVKQMIYDDSSGLIASQLGSSDQSSNHNLAQFEETGSLAGPSSISLLSRHNEENSFNNNSTTSANHNSSTQIAPLIATNSNTQQSTSSINNQSTSLPTSLLPMQMHPSSLGNISAALPSVTSRQSLAFNFDSLSTKRHFSCPICYKTFSEKAISGLNDDFDADQLLHTSSLANSTLHSANALSQLQHNQSNIPGGEEIITNEDGTNKPKRIYQCNLCFKKFDIRYSLQRHLKVIHDPQRHLFTCNVCNKKFAWKSAFSRHVNVTCNRQRKGT